MNYQSLTAPLLDKAIRKSTKVFDDKKVTDHHAIIPTGITPSGISPDEQKIYIAIAKRFISVFYPDCTVSNTTVLGNVEEIDFKATGKQIIEPGWRVVYEQEELDRKAKNAEPKKPETDENSGDEIISETAVEDENIMPQFAQGEKGPHIPEAQEKETHPPKYYTEATLLRGMETAGKTIDDEELRDAMKENGIGRPSTRANIIETLFRRQYITKKKKNLHATVTGVGLIDTIPSDLLKSAELTGQWEKKLRLIERGEYDVVNFRKELVEMVVNLTNEVMNSKGKTIQFTAPESIEKTTTENRETKSETTAKKSVPREKKVVIIEGQKCPKCNEGSLLKGKSAYGCSRHREGCKYLLPYQYQGKKLTEKQVEDLLLKKQTAVIKGFSSTEFPEKRDGKLIFNVDFNLTFQPI